MEIEITEVKMYSIWRRARIGVVLVMAWAMRVPLRIAPFDSAPGETGEGARE